MITKTNKYIQSAVCNFLERNEDEWTKYLAEAREDRRIREESKDKQLATLKSQKSELKTKPNNLEVESAAPVARLKELEAIIK